jgi:NADH-quinone oxidoreductase subunit A
LLSEYFPLLLTIVAAAVVSLSMIAISMLFGPRRHSPEKDRPFECGFAPERAPRYRFPVKFYVVAMLFLIFDIETLFLFPWAVNFRALGWIGFVDMLIFAGVLAAGLIYAWRARGLEWD